MIFTPPPEPPAFARFRLKLLVAMMLVVSAVAAVGLAFAQRSAAANARRGFEREFEERLASLHAVEDVRNAVLAERCRELALRPRIHAALEDNALDLLYPSARDELADLMAAPGAQLDAGTYALHAKFYRFLNASGAVISPSESGVGRPPGNRSFGLNKPGRSPARTPAATDDGAVGKLLRAEESQLSLPSIPEKPQIGYLWRQTGGGSIDELIAMPILSTETGEVIAAIVLGFKPGDSSGVGQLDAGIKGGIWLGGGLVLPSLDSSSREQIASKVGRRAAAPGRIQGSFEIRAGGAPYLLFYKRLNPDSLYPPACEVILYPLAGLLATQRHLFWQFAGAAGVILLGALGISNFLSGRLSRPVEKLAEDSEENRAQRKRAEAALDLTSRELQRSARFSADASHQLKTPVTVLRAGLEELLAGEDLSPSTREEVSALIHQTFRLTSIVEDLLLLSRLDAGRLQISFSPVNLRGLIEAGLDDLGTLTESVELQIETDLPPVLTIAGEKRYTSLILQNLLENARKYNRPGGRIRIAAREEGNQVVLTVGNTGGAISPSAQEHIFERFHRGAAGENLPGHGLGLNLARELARIHGGELRLVLSEEDWTEFEIRFRRVGDAAAGGGF